MITPGFLAGAGTVNAENAIQSLIPSGSTVSQIAIYTGALLLVAMGGFVWAITFRRQGHQRPSHHHRSKSTAHRQQPEARPRPRTLAEAGGLPPIRTGQ
jgi:hypothetical protein